MPQAHLGNLTHCQGKGACLENDGEDCAHSRVRDHEDDDHNQLFIVPAASKGLAGIRGLRRCYWPTSLCGGQRTSPKTNPGALHVGCILKGERAESSLEDHSLRVEDGAQ